MPLLALEFLHQVLPGGPHPTPLSIDIHWNSKYHENQLNDSYPYEYLSGTVAFQPGSEKQAEYQSVENIFREI